MTYAEYLKNEGASAEEIAVLDTPVARRAFDKLETARVAEAQRATTAEANQASYKKWYEETAVPEFQGMQTEVRKTKAEEARVRALLLAARDQGLIELTADMGFTPTGTPATPAAPAATGFDDKKYYTRDEILAIAQQEGDAIALAQDISAEHKALFPDKPLNFRDLRRQAQAAKKSVEQVWMDTYGVPAARTAAATAQRDAEIAKWKAEGAKEKETELVSKFANPETRPLSTSISPLAPRPTTGRDKQPWESPEGSMGSERVERVTRNLLTNQVRNPN